MMGNQRQVLKGNIEKELVTKIETAKDVLVKLTENLEACKDNSNAAKQDIGKAVETIKNVLSQRKKELTDEVDALYGAQVRSLEESMRATYITMGRLQNMLTNLDSFDQGQLVQLEIPDISMTYEISEPSQVNIDLDCDQIKEDITEWGSVSTDDGFQCCLMETSTPQTARNPSVDLEETGKNESQVVPAKISAVCASCPWNAWGIENWLSSSKSGKVSLKPSSLNDFVLPNQCFETTDIEDFVVPGDFDTPNDSESSIACLEKDGDSEISENSQWLKPCQSKSKLGSSPCWKFNAAMLSSDASCFLSGKRKCPLGTASRKSLDFPCLQMTPDTWVHPKKCKNGGPPPCSQFLAKSTQSKLMPPNYALPNPFWLKKYQQQQQQKR